MKTRHKFWGGVALLSFLTLLLTIPVIVINLSIIFSFLYIMVSCVGYYEEDCQRILGNYNLFYLIKIGLKMFNKWLDTFDKE